MVGTEEHVIQEIFMYSLLCSVSSLPVVFIHNLTVQSHLPPKERRGPIGRSVSDRTCIKECQPLCNFYLGVGVFTLYSVGVSAQTCLARFSCQLALISD